MNQKIKKYLKIFQKLNRKWLFLALSFFVIFGLFFTFQPALAQIGGLQCDWWNVACLTASYVFSILIKIVVLVVFAIPLLISALAVAIVGLILGWIISPDFISLKFTQNPFVDIGLFITKGFANMGFILFLVVIALATILRIEEYRAKKTLPTLIIIALLINFSPVLCGFIIDFTNVVMNFFLSNIVGINAFVDRIMEVGSLLWNSFWNSGLDLWANIAAAMQVIVAMVFNWFAAFIFILFCALFVMRYIMLWILVILSPIAFVSYILPITRRGGSLLSWRKWWTELISWSIIGIIAGFFLYLGFTMISLTTANSSALVSQSAIGQLGLMNNILPYLIPLVLLWIGYRETKRTTAMFAREIMEIPEKVTKAAVSTAMMAGVAIGTAGAGAAVGVAGTAAKGLSGAAGRFSARLRNYGEKHEDTLSGTVAKTVSGGINWVGERATAIRGVPKVVKEEYEEYKEKHPRFDKITQAGGWVQKQAKAGLDEILYGLTKKTKVKGRKLREEEKKDNFRYKEETKTTKEPFSPSEKEAGIMVMPNGEKRKLTKEDKERGFVSYTRKTGDWIKTDQKLTKEEINSDHLIEIGRTRRPGGIKPLIQQSLKQTLEEIKNKYVKGFTSLSEELRTEALSQAKRDLETIGNLSDETKEKMRASFRRFREMEERGESFNRDDLEKFEKRMKRKRKKKPDSDSESESED